MPRANPRTSFETAVKHLVRHLHDASALRENPLTSRLFPDVQPSAAGADRAALARVHLLFRAAAERCHREDAEGGRRDRARRQFAIAIDDCLGRTPKRALASRLGISIAEYYRERADICARIAHCMRDGASAPRSIAPAFDEFAYGMTHAAEVAELGDADRAIEAYRRSYESECSPAQKIEALCERALVHVRRDPSENVEHLIRAAEALLARSAILNDREQHVAHAYLHFVRGMTAWQNSPPSALASFEAALSRLERASLTPDDPKRTLHVRVLFEYGEALTTFQDIRGSVETLAKAAKLLAASQARSPDLALKIEIVLALFRSSMLVDPFGWDPLRARLDCALGLSRRAQLTGSADLNLRALNAVAQLQARAGNAAQALHSARSALALANYGPSRETFSEVNLRMARTLMYTPLWHTVPETLRAAGAPATVAVAASRHLLLAEYALRRGQASRAHEMLRAPNVSQRPFARVLAAEAARELGHRREAVELIERTVPTIEKSGIALTTEQTYRVAGRVTRDRRYVRKADEIAQALRA